MSHRPRNDERLAELYDAEVLPLWTQRFARMLFRGLEVPPTGEVLDLACASGYTTVELLRRLDAGAGRIVALESSSVLLDLARKKVGPLAGKRIFFRTERARKLPFANDVYDLVVSNLGLSDVDDPHGAVLEWARVTRPGGTLALTCAARGTWQELIDIYREVLVKLERPAVLARLESYVASLPTTDELLAWFEEAGLEDVNVEVEEFQLLFKSGREFFFAPVIEYGPLDRWKDIAGSRDEMQDLFWQIKQAIDTYFVAPHPFAVTVVAASLRGKKPPPREPAASPDAREPAASVSAPEPAASAGASEPAPAPAAPEPDPSPDGDDPRTLAAELVSDIIAAVDDDPSSPPERSRSAPKPGPPEDW